MIAIRNFSKMDRQGLVENNVAASLEEAEKMIAEWNNRRFDGNYFEMFAVYKEETIVGMISLWERSQSIVSIGPEIFSQFRAQGLGKQALEACMQFAKEKGYRLVVQQIRENNTASIALHTSLGFETDGSLLKNRKGNNVFIYVKLLK